MDRAPSFYLGCWGFESLDGRVKRHDGGGKHLRERGMGTRTETPQATGWDKPVMGRHNGLAASVE